MLYPVLTGTYVRQLPSLEASTKFQTTAEFFRTVDCSYVSATGDDVEPKKPKNFYGISPISVYIYVLRSLNKRRLMGAIVSAEGGEVNTPLLRLSTTTIHA